MKRQIRIGVFETNSSSTHSVSIYNRSKRVFSDIPRDSEVILDDRNVRAGVKFKDMDLIGIPVRIVVGEKNLPNVEIKLRAGNESELVPVEAASEKTASIVREALAKLND